MKKFDLIKTVQLVIYTIFAASCVLYVLFNKELYHAIASNSDMRLICTLLWGCFGMGFIFILIDFRFISTYKKDFRELDHAVHSDPVSGIANRNSCDEIIEKYLDKPLPDGIGCIMFDIVNIKEINAAYGHLQGNELIRDFSTILKMSSLSLCFVGRNGGNKFLAIFEDSKREHINLFLNRIKQRVSMYNVEHPDKPIKYKRGVAFEEGSEVKTITDLVALSNRRIYEET